jgi:hypothetical protein
MTRDELLQFHAELCKAARDLMSLKNRDYAGKDGLEPFANFTRVEAMGICKTEQGFMVRLTDKMSRLSSFIHAGKMNVQDESFMDTCVDVINYMVLLAAYLKDKDSESN